MYAILILALVASVTADVFVESQCPDTKPVENFNFAAFGQGTWYEVARYPNSAVKRGKCGFAEYVLDGGAENTGKLIYALPYEPSGTETKNKLNILATDYTNYAIGYFCKYDDTKKNRQDFAWILSRTKTLEDTMKTTVENYIKESKFLDITKFTWPEFTDAACKVEE